MANKLDPMDLKQIIGLHMDRISNKTAELQGKLGKHLEAVVSGNFSCGDHPKINYKRAMGIIQLQKSNGAERLDKAFERALHAGIFSFQRLKTCLKTIPSRTYRVTPIHAGLPIINKPFKKGNLTSNFHLLL